MPSAPRLERATAAAVLVPALSVALVVVLGWLSLIGAPAFGLCAVALAVASYFGAGPEALALLRGDLAAARAAMRALRSEPLSVAALALSLAAVALSILATHLLPVWAWDTLGYHLPIVHDALSTGTVREIPTHIPYVNAYPRLVDLAFVAWRLSVGREAWVELAQLPFLPAAVLAIAAIAARGGVPTPRALASGSLFITVPVAMLELPSGYIDIAVAALVLSMILFITGPLSRGTLILSAIAAGFLLGSKPSAPPIVAAALLVLLVRSHRSGVLGQGIAASLVAALIGSGKYVENLVVRGNPIWPVELALGPLRFPGEVAMSELTVAGLVEPYRSMGWLGRVTSSWTAFPETFIYDMRLGGLGPLFNLGLLPVSICVLGFVLFRPAARARFAPVALPITLVVVLTLASPGAHWARYTLAVPGALLALSAVALEGLERRARWAAMVALVLLSGSGMMLSWRGLSAGGPDLFTLATLSQEARLRAFSMDEQELDWRDARESVGPGEAFAYDRSYGLPGRLVRDDGGSRVLYYPEDEPTFASLDAWLRRERVRVIVLADPGTASLARAHPERFSERFRSLYPAWQACAVFDVRD